MNLRHIEIFHAVYVNGSVSAAARALNVSQPSVSKMLRHAESLLGFQLFQRTNGGLVPTEDAHSLFAEVREIQDRVHALREAGRNLRRGIGGTLRISALPSLALDAIPDRGRALPAQPRECEVRPADRPSRRSAAQAARARDRHRDRLSGAAGRADRPALARRRRAGGALSRGGHARRAALHRAASAAGPALHQPRRERPDRAGSSPRSCSGRTSSWTRSCPRAPSTSPARWSGRAWG